MARKSKWHRYFERDQHFRELATQKRFVRTREGLLGGEFRHGAKEWSSLKAARAAFEQAVAVTLAEGYVEKPVPAPVAVEKPAPKGVALKPLARRVKKQVTKLVSPDGQSFWTATWFGLQLATHGGAIGTRGEHKQEFNQDSEALLAKYEAQVASKRAAGWVDAKKR